MEEPHGLSVVRFRDVVSIAVGVQLPFDDFAFPAAASDGVQELLLRLHEITVFTHLSKQFHGTIQAPALKFMRVGYCRVSTSSGEQLSALESQVARIKATGVHRVITDVESGLSNEREGMNELLSLIDSRKVTEIVATRVDRLGRDASATDSLIVLAGRRGVKITTLDGGQVEAETPTGFLMARLSTSLAEMESKMLSLRVRRGFEQRRKTHKPCRGKAPWGYAISPDKSRIVPNPATWDKAKQFLDILRSTEWRMNTALDRFEGECPLNSCRAVKAWLRNPILRGGIGYLQQKNHTFAEIVWDLHEPLISHEEYRQVLLKMEENRRHWGSNAQRKPKILTGLCWCPNCGKKLTYAGSRTINSVICTTRGCVSRYKGTRESVIVEQVNKALAANAEQLGQHITEEPPEAAVIRDQIDQLQKFNDPDLEDAIIAKQQKLRSIMVTASPKDRERIAALANPRAWEMATEEELRMIYLEFVGRIEADRGEVLKILLKL